MSNPVFNNSDVFGPNAQRNPAGAQVQNDPRFGSASQMSTAGGQAMDAAMMEQMYNAPSANSIDTDRMTYDDIIMKTGSLLAILIVAGAATWILAPGLYIVGAIGGLVLGLINAFKKEPSPALIVGYTLFQGMFLGGLSKFYETAYNGIVLQAVLGTVSVFIATLFLFKSGKVRVTPKFNKILLVGLVGYAIFSLLNLILVATGVLDGWGMRGGTMGLIIGLVAVVLAAMALVQDFDMAATGVRNGIPKRYAWSAAFGLMVTLIWLYTEILRILAILRSGD